MKKSQLGWLLVFLLTFLNIGFWLLYPQKTTALYQVELVDAIELPLPKSPAVKLTNQFPELTAQAIYALDLNSLTVLYEKNADTPLYPASTTKMMTALVAVDHFDLGQELTVVSEATTAGTRLPLFPGQKMSVGDLLASMMIASANDSAYLLANHYPGGMTAFVQAMNQRALALGLEQTRFSNPAGLDESEQQSSARDLTVITRELLKNDFLRELVATPYLEIPSQMQNMPVYQLRSTNQLFGLIGGIKGVKTGTTELAGEVLITLIERDGHQILITLMNSQDRYADTSQLVQWIFNNYEWRELSLTQYNTAADYAESNQF